MINAALFILIGFALLIFGANWLVGGASALAKKYRISDLAIGLTVVAFGTSAPELVVNSIASLENHSDIVFGNVIGSNNFNLFIILGIVGLILPISVQSSTVWKEIPISFLAAILLLFLVNDYFYDQAPVFSRTDGMLLLSCFVFFMYYVYSQLEKDSTEPEVTISGLSNLKISGHLIFGLLGLIFGGKLVVDNAIEMATNLGVSEKVIGLTIIAAGTSLPELVTSVVAAFKKNSDIAVGNVIGSNIFNILLIVSTSAIIQPIPYNTNFNFDLYLLLGGTAFLFLAMFTGTRKKLDRWEAALLLAVYIGYIAYQIFKY